MVISAVVAVDTRARLVDVRFDDKTLLYAYDELGQLLPAYANGTQGAGVRISGRVVAAARAWRMLRRQLLYTAMTRAQRLLIVVTQGDALERAVRTVLPPRHSMLRYLLQEETVS
ncbi:MAG: hypothetical protein R3D03_08245 [Geminicoccaceae bacterium]